MTRKTHRRKHRRPPKVAPLTTPDMTAHLTPGERIQVRRYGERRWKDHVVRWPIEFRTTGRRGTWLYGEYLHYEIRKRVSAATPRTERY
jgi:hypothetical protein